MTRNAKLIVIAVVIGELFLCHGCLVYADSTYSHQQIYSDCKALICT